MKIGIIGAGNIGGTLAPRLRALGQEVFVANSRGPATLADVERETGAKAVTAKEAARSREVVIGKHSGSAHSRPADRFVAGVPGNVVVVDTGNYYPRQRDGVIPEIEAGLPESRWVERQIGRPVVKAFNNISAKHLMENGRPRRDARRIALPVSGDDPKAKAVVMKNDLGFDAVDAGSLDESWRKQPGTPVYGTDHNSECVRCALKEASSQRRSEFQATEKSPDLTRSPLKAGAMSKGLTKAGPDHQSHDGDRAIQGLDSSRANLRIRLSDFLKQPAD